MTLRFSVDLSCQYLLIAERAFPVADDESQCKDGEAFFEVSILTRSPFFKIVCKVA